MISQTATRVHYSLRSSILIAAVMSILIAAVMAMTGTMPLMRLLLLMKKEFVAKSLWS
jgi:hypothetical protein